MRIALAQIDPVVGSFDVNVAKIKEAYERACVEQARLLLTPELGICGYPPHDLLDRPEIFDRNAKALAELTALTQGRACALVVGHVARNPAPTGRAAQNVVSVLEKGREVFRQAKMLLPTYDVFDEARYFEPAPEVKLWHCDGLPIALPICEDLWARDPALGRSLYGHDPVQLYAAAGAKLVLAISASPYIYGKREHREALHADIARRLKAPLIYVNQVGATDEILFDGGSFVLSANGATALRLPQFERAFQLVTLNSASGGFAVDEAASTLPISELEVLVRGLVTGIHEYFARTGFKKCVIGLSGGIDSAVVGALAVIALKRENVMGIGMPSQYSSSHSLEDAEELASSLGIQFEVQPIKFLFSTAARTIGEARDGELAPLALENLQSRLRGVILMTLSNHYGALVLTTGNKSELATGYCTQYGDMVGALAPLGDLFKTRVYEVAREINRLYGPIIPARSISKPPSAELRPDQTDQDSLPPYDALDALLADYLERAVPVDELERSHGPRVAQPGWVRRILRLIEVTEFKRRQAAPVLKISAKAFGIGRRIPIAKRWDQ